MVKTLKITSILAVVATIGVVIFLAMVGFRSDPQRDKILNASGAIEEFKKGATKPAEKHEEISPLIKQAKLFALLINPPPPPKPPKPKVKPKKVATKPATKIVKPLLTPKGQVAAKFTLLGTCRNVQSPESSFALLALGRKKQKWVQQGQVIEHLTIQEIKDGSIITFKNGRFNNELAMQKTKSKIKSLLLKDALSDSQPPAAVSTGVVEALTLPTPEAPAYGAQRIKPKPAPSVRPSPKPQPRKPVLRRTGRRSVPSSKSRPGPTTRTRKPLPEPTPQQRKKSLDDSIVGIKEIMKEPATGVTEAQRAEERKAWDQLLDILQQERGEVEGEIKKKNDDSQGPKK